MMKSIALAFGLLIASGAASAQTVAAVGIGSRSVGTTPVEVFGQATGTPRQYLWLTNVSPAGSPSVWCSESTATPAPNVAGSYELLPGTPNGREFYANGLAPQGAIWCVAASGTVQLTAEAQ